MDGYYYCPACGAILEPNDPWRSYTCPDYICPDCGGEFDEVECVDYFEATAEDIAITAAIERAHGI